MFGSCSSFNDSDEEEDSLPTSSPRPTRDHCNKNVGNQHYSSRSPRCIFQRSPFLITNDNELMSRLSTLPMLDSVSSAHKIGMKQQVSASSSIPPSPPQVRRRIMPPVPPSKPQLVTTTTIPTTAKDIKMPQSNSSKRRPSGSCLRRSRYSFPSELSEIAARNVDYALSDSKSVSFYSQVSVLEFENDEEDTDTKDSSESWFKNFSRGFGI